MPRVKTKYFVGSVHPTRNCGDVTIKQLLSKDYVVVVFEDTGNWDTVHIGNLGRGNVLDKAQKGGACRKGTIHKTNRHGDIEVVEFVSQRDITVKFINTGNLKRTCIANIRSGYIADI